MRTVQIAAATAPLSEYARRARKGTVVVMRRGRPLAAVVPLDSADWEDFVVSQDPGFIEIIKRSEARYNAEGGIPLAEIERRFGLAPKASRRRARKPARKRR